MNEYNIMNLNNFSNLATLTKKVKRAGWLTYLPKQVVESVSDHSYGVAVLALSLRNEPGVDFGKCVQMGLIHDIAEGIVGDYTPHDPITPQCKHALEQAAFQRIFKELGESNAKYYMELWLEYEAGKTEEAKMVKDMDKLEMMQQALRYEREHKVDLSQFYQVVGRMKTQYFRKQAELLLHQRNDK